MIKKLKKASVFICALFLTFSSHAQDINISNSSIEQVGDSIMIHFDVEVEKLRLNYRLDIKPVIYKDTLTKELESIVYASYVKHVVDIRKDRRFKDITYIRKREIVRYTASVPFEKWMNGFSLRADRTIEAYGISHILPSILISDDNLPRIYNPFYDRDVAKAYQYNLEEYINSNFPIMRHYNVSNADFERHNQDGTSVHFKQGSSNIDTLNNDNSLNLQKINDALEFIESRSDIALNRISIIGSTSIEGSSSLNKKLASKRSTQLISCFTGVALEKFDVFTIGENWVGLRDLVDKSTMTYREEVLSIIDTYSNPDIREKHLMKLAKGAPYRYMTEHYFGQLRRASCIHISYDIILNEEINREQEAVDLIDQKLYDSALEILNTLSVSASRDNLKGVCYMMLRDITNADDFFKRAIDNGSKHAIDNLKELNS